MASALHRSSSMNRSMDRASRDVNTSFRREVLGRSASERVRRSAPRSATTSRSTSTMRLRTLTIAVAFGLAGVTGFATPATAAPTWAPAASAPIHPGVQTYTAGAQCTANFVFTNGTDVFIGQAAHCSGTGAATETDGCLAESLPLGTPVEVTGATRPGTLVYNSWLSM